METELRTRIIAASGLTASRVSWGLRPAGKPTPAITLTSLQVPAAYTMGGRDGTQQHRIQIDIWGEKYAEIKAIDDLVVAALEQASGNFLAGFDLGKNVTAETMQEGALQRISRDFRITYVTA